MKRGSKGQETSVSCQIRGTQIIYRILDKGKKISTLTHNNRLPINVAVAEENQRALLVGY